MSLINYFGKSLLFHVLLLIPIFLYTAKTQVVDEDIIPDEWIIKADIILWETPKDKNISHQPRQGKNDVPAIKEKNEQTNEKASLVDSTSKSENKLFNILQSPSLIPSVNEQFLILKTKSFFNSVRAAAKGLIDAEITDKKRYEINYTSASVLVNYSENKLVDEIKISSESEELKTILEKMDWKSLPIPSAYLLSYKALNLKISVNDSRIIVGIEVL